MSRKLFFRRIKVEFIFVSLDRLFDKRLSFTDVCQVCYYTDEQFQILFAMHMLLFKSQMFADIKLAAASQRYEEVDFVWMKSMRSS